MLLNSTGLRVKVLVSSLLLLTSWMNLSAAPLTPEQALNRLKSSTAAKRVVGNTTFELAHTEKLNNQDYLFVFNRNNDGFIIASADDRMPALLGYSDNGAFDMATASPELKWWLGQYAVQASQSLNSIVSPLADEGSADSSREEIPVLIKTKWNQGAPFNNACPEDDGGKCVTGCVATAMAQVIKYHGYPSQGKGSHTYDWNDGTLSYDYENAVFDFSNMLDEYGSDATEVERAAVANLMHACGVGVNMSYTSKESGAQDLNVAYALQEFFNYSSDIRYLDRELFSDNDWEDIVYEELKAGRPVIYGGHTKSNSGHEFICDGYKDGFFHINWGWGGMSDGYFSLSVLDPAEQGIGGAQSESENGFTESQAIICGIHPKEEGDLRSSNPFFATDGIIGGDIYQSQMLVAFTKGHLDNYYPEEITVNFYIKAISESDGEAVYSQATPMTFGARIYYTQFWLDMPTYLTQGDYKLFIVYKMSEGDDYCNLPIPHGMSDYIEVSVDESGSVKLKDEIKPSITASTFSPTTDVFSGKYSEFEIFVSNTGMAGYHGSIYVRTFDKTTNENLTEYEIENITLLANHYIKGTISVPFNDSENKPLPAGEYNLQCFDMYDSPISELQTLKIYTLPNSVSLDNTEVTLTMGSTYTLAATVDPVSEASKIWKSSEKKIATVDDDGNVTAVGVGKATITVTCGKSARCVVTCNPIVGDADWNGSITITDAVDISNYVVGKKIAPEGWEEDEWKSFYMVGANANKDQDGKISFADASAAVALALEQPGASVQSRINAYGDFNETSDALVVGAWADNDRASVPVTLDNSMQYVALQADLTVPEGLTVNVKAGGRIANSHSFVARRINDNTIRVAIFDLGNRAFVENDQPLFEVMVDSNILDPETIAITNILASDSDANEYVLSSRSEVSNGVTGVSNDNISVVKCSNGILIKNIIGKQVEVYTLDGRFVRSFKANRDSETINLSSGVYVVKVGNQTLKIVL